jgi:hypothetical protein
MFAPPKAGIAGCSVHLQRTREGRPQGVRLPLGCLDAHITPNRGDDHARSGDFHGGLGMTGLARL